MIPSSKMTLYRYDVAVSPETAGKKLNQVIRLLLESPDLASVREDIVTDFKSTMISRQRFQEDEKEIDIQYRSEKEDEPREDATTYHVRLLYTKTLRVSDLMNYLTSTNIGDHYDDKLSMVQALNIFLNHHAKSTGNLVTIGASKSFSLSNTSEKYTLKGGLTAIRGFFSSVRLASYRILVNVNVTHGAFYDSDRLDALIHNFGSDPYKVNRFLQRLKISSTHLAQRRNKAGEVIIRPKTIQGLATVTHSYILHAFLTLARVLRTSNSGLKVHPICPPRRAPAARRKNRRNPHLPLALRQMGGISACLISSRSVSAAHLQHQRIESEIFLNSTQYNCFPPQYSSGECWNQGEAQLSSTRGLRRHSWTSL
jgi:hypothetical protein